MATLNIQFPDEVLNKIGKVLLLSYGHGLDVSEIQRLTRASQVRLIDLENSTEVDRFVVYTCSRALKTLEIHDDLDCYYIVGDDAVSSMLALRTDKFLFALKLDALTFKQLHNSSLLYHQINSLIFQMDVLKQMHLDVIANLTSIKIKNKISSKTNALEKIAAGYGVDDLERQRSSVRSLMTNRW